MERVKGNVSEETDLWIEVINQAIIDLTSPYMDYRIDAQKFLKSKQCRELFDNLHIGEAINNNTDFDAPHNLGYSNLWNTNNKDTVYKSMIKKLKQGGLL